MLTGAGPHPEGSVDLDGPCNLHFDHFRFAPQPGDLGSPPFCKLLPLRIELCTPSWFVACFCHCYCVNFPLDFFLRLGQPWPLSRVYKPQRPPCRECKSARDCLVINSTSLVASPHAVMTVSAQSSKGGRWRSRTD